MGIRIPTLRSWPFCHAARRIHIDSPSNSAVSNPKVLRIDENFEAALAD
jgi:hypothetical protein